MSIRRRSRPCWSAGRTSRRTISSSSSAAARSIASAIEVEVQPGVPGRELRRRRARCRASHQVARRHHHRGHREEAGRDPALAGQGGARARPAAERMTSMSKRLLCLEVNGRLREDAVADHRSCCSIILRDELGLTGPSAAATAANAARARCWSTASRGLRASRWRRAAAASAWRRSKGWRERAG